MEPAEILGDDQDTYRLTNVVDERTDACFLNGVTRAMVLRLTQRIQPSRVNVLDGATASYRLRFDRFRLSPTEFEMLDRTGLVSGLANPTKLGDHGGVSDAVAPDVGLVYFPSPAYCVYRIVMVFESIAERKFRLRVWFDARWKGSIDCPLSGVGRWVLITFREPVAAKDVREEIEGP